MRKVVVVEPEKPGNLGFIARLCANFDFGLRVVKPDFNLEKSRKTASRAQEVLRNVEIFETVEDAVEDLGYVVGTKPGRGQSCKDFSFKENTSIMIGRESKGLSNQELGLCDAVVHISTGEYSSLNQSHAAGILLYEAFELEETGLSPGLKNSLEEEFGDELAEVIVEANPSDEKAGRVYRQLLELRDK